MAEVDPHHVDPGPQQPLEGGGLRRGRAEGGNDLRATTHGCLSSRSMATHAPNDDPTADLRRFLDASPSPWHAVATADRDAVGSGLRRVRRARRVGRCPRARLRRARRRPDRVGRPARRPDPHRGRPHRLARPARHPASRRGAGRLEPARGRDLRRRVVEQLARPGSRCGRTGPHRRRCLGVGRCPRADRTGPAVGHPPRSRGQRARRPARPPRPHRAGLGHHAGCAVRPRGSRTGPASTTPPDGSCACTTSSRRPCSEPTGPCWPVAGWTTRSRAGPPSRRWSTARADRTRTAMIALFDHEEVGSASTTGAAGPFLETVLARRWDVAGVHGDARHRLLAASSCVSADNAHAIHPNYPERHDPSHAPQINHGPAVKLNANQRYATSADTAALFVRVCEEAGVPVPDLRVAQQRAVRVHHRAAHRHPSWASPPSTSACPSCRCTPPANCAAPPTPATSPTALTTLPVELTPCPTRGLRRRGVGARRGAGR